MSRDPYFQNAQAEALRPDWTPRLPCAGCDKRTATYSRIRGAIYCPECARVLRTPISADERLLLAIFGPPDRPTQETR